MSVFTKQAFTMSAIPTPANSAPPSAPVSRRSSFTYPVSSGAITPAADPHIVEINVESVLFDMDGTLINSSPAVVKAWQLFAETYPLDLEDILACEYRCSSEKELELTDQPPTACERLTS